MHLLPSYIFFQIPWKMRHHILVTFYISFEKITFYAEILTWKVELWIFFIRFTHEKMPQNNFSQCLLTTLCIVITYLILDQICLDWILWLQHMGPKCDNRQSSPHTKFMVHNWLQWSWNSTSSSIGKSSYGINAL